jgi:hypothetical protein
MMQGRELSEWIHLNHEREFEGGMGIWLENEKNYLEDVGANLMIILKRIWRNNNIYLAHN